MTISLAELVETRRRTSAINRAIAEATRSVIASRGAAKQSEVIAAVCERRKKDDPGEIRELVVERFKRGRFGWGRRARIGEILR